MSTLYQCPSCGKDNFKDHGAVARHMSQPRSGCSTWLQDLIHLHSVSVRTTADSMDVDHTPNIPNVDPELDGTGFGDWDGVFQGRSGEGDDQVHEGGTPTGSDFIDWHPKPSQTYGRGYTFLDSFHSDENNMYHTENHYYLFSGQRDWEVALWLLRSGLSMAKVDSFLSLEMIKSLPLSFYSAKELRGRAEILPGSPPWMSQVIPTAHPTKSPVILYWCDPLECIVSLLNHPFFHDRMDFTPCRVYATAQRLCHVYSEWMTGDDAWNMQSALPGGAMLFGTILSSDKTNISVMTGDRVAHPLLISLANIHMSTRLKSSSNAFILTALLPVPKFIHKKKDRLIHECLNIVLCPLKQAAREGVMLSDPVGHSQYCFTPLVSYIVDTPEAMMLATVGGKTSPVTMAMYKQFGDPFRHEPRTKSTTLAQLRVAQVRADPDDIEAFFHETQKFCLNGVSDPFFADWILSEPSHFLTPETLHHIHREFYDHDVKWLICAVGDVELDFRFSVLQPITGFRHFHEGISKLKQVTGRAQCDIQRSIIALSADVAPSAVITAIRALMDFCYLVQSPRIDNNVLEHISAALSEFHANKDAIIAGGFHRGQHNRVIENWYIPKIELMQSIVPSIRNSGVIMQWTADTTEHAHITEIKDPTCSSNNNNYNSQICCHLDCADKCCHFDLATSLLKNMPGSNQQTSDHDDSDSDDVEFDVDNDIPAELLVTIKSPGHSYPITNHFAIAKLLQDREVGTVPVPLRSFSVGSLKFEVPDLQPAIADFLSREAAHGQDFVHTIGGARRAGPTALLPFEKLQVWFKLRLQDTDLHDISVVRPAQTLNCSPPSGVWTCGRYDLVLVNNNARCSWPADGLRGHTVGEIRLILRPVGKAGTYWSWKDHFLAYVYRFNVIPQGGSDREPSTQLHILKRARRSNGTWVSDVVPVTQLRAPVNLVPRFGVSADNHLTPYNSMEHASEFWLNKYWDKNTYLPLSM
ncbi:hypothetical protein CY34DRAFT_25513 [Suillus luteus UH-Slu-Lm8-n1]|uniref:DUF6830 domain-containing protein n=1 Tax=Suillus luteus UH-Slu-Lm8-n1 TaxID=930992 RepID=A0A0C9ZMA8_9AGAM|nr:hypothetical protein CY34DRAFT_25513 [Suillus luteus UH-Slu-Lm8-n1]